MDEQQNAKPLSQKAHLPLAYKYIFLYKREKFFTYCTAFYNTVTSGYLWIFKKVGEKSYSVL